MSQVSGRAKAAARGSCLPLWGLSRAAPPPRVGTQEAGGSALGRDSNKRSSGRSPLIPPLPGPQTPAHSPRPCPLPGIPAPQAARPSLNSSVEEPFRADSQLLLAAEP